MACGSVFPCDDDSDDDPENVRSKKNDCLDWTHCDAAADDHHCWCLCIGDRDDDLDLVLGEIL